MITISGLKQFGSVERGGLWRCYNWLGLSFTSNCIYAWIMVPLNNHWNRPMAYLFLYCSKNTSDSRCSCMSFLILKVCRGCSLDSPVRRLAVCFGVRVCGCWWVKPQSCVWDSPVPSAMCFCFWASGQTHLGQWNNSAKFFNSVLTVQWGNIKETRFVVCVSSLSFLFP